ncbi:hypothetical protein DASC09_053320 [Saccharomycopsis crataegensis]|uniref:Uncharacterized protein n=1 Tax=Saccharomycopsis crataegensis TaxID=43959 RepID=A0AAV5QT02_9ASCO|nr:hypothetical protein DASC09_053320 [Saccharomycopsis crataegensis]
MKLSTSILTSVLAGLTLAREVEVLEPSKRDVSVPDWATGFLGTTYTPFDQYKNCRSADQIKEDVGYLSSFEILRLYSNDCNVVQYAAEVFPGKLMVAVNDISSTDAIRADLNSIATSIGYAGKQFNDAVHSVIVGNELIYNGWYTAAEVANFINEARSIYPDFPGMWTTAETASSFYGNPDLCGAVDYVGINNHPYFDGQTPETAGSYVLGHIEAVAEFCEEHGHNKQTVTLETGWPWAGNADGVAVPSSENQVTAIKNIQSAAANDCILFSAYNELWKTSSVWDVEKNWGFMGNAPSAW